MSEYGIIQTGDTYWPSISEVSHHSAAHFHRSTAFARLFDTKGGHTVRTRPSHEDD